MTDPSEHVLRVGSVGEIAGLNVFTPELLDVFNVLVYGDSGVGKTTLLASAAAVSDTSPVLLIDIEFGSTSTREFPNLHIVRPSSFKEIIDILNALKKDNPYKTVIVDSLTEMQRLGTESVMRRTAKKAREKGDDKDPDHPDWGDWTKSHNLFRRTVRAYRDLNCNTLFTALAKTDTTRPKHPKAKPNLNGIMADEIAASLDIVLYLEKQEIDGQIRRVAHADGPEDIVTKDRFSALGTRLLDPTFRTIISKIQEKEN